MSQDAVTTPNWDHLFEIAAAQAGLFTTKQAAEAGYSSQLIAHHVGAGRMSRVRRGVYRLVHYPPDEHEDLSLVWLWSEQEGVFSNQTALSLHDLSDVLPARVHLTVPEAWRARRLRVPDGVVLHYADLEDGERRWFGPVPATAPLRTLLDCAAEHLPPELLRVATLDALRQGLVAPEELDVVRAALEPFGGLEP